MASRKIKKLFKGKPVIEGAGVHLKRAFGFGEVPAHLWKTYTRARGMVRSHRDEYSGGTSDRL